MKDPVFKRYQLLAEYSTDIIATMAPDGSFTFVSPAVKFLLGYKPEDLIGKNSVDFIYPEDRAIVANKHWRRILDHGKWVFSYRLLNSRGAFVWFESSGQPIFNSETGELEEIILVSREITERVKFEDRLKKALREVSNARMAIDLHNAVSITDENGVLLYVNELLCAKTGYTRVELIGKSQNTLTCVDFSSDHFEGLWSTVKKGEVWKGEVCNRTKDEDIYWLEYSVIPLKNSKEEVYRFLWVGTDITEKKKQLEEIRLKSRALESTIEGVAILDAKSDGFPVIFSNSSFSRITGFENAEILGNNYSMFQGANTHLNVIDKLMMRMRHTIPFEDEVVHYKKDGTPFWNNIRISPLINDNGDVTHFVAMNRDVTEEKIVQLKLDMAVEQLEARVKERTQQLSYLNDTLKKEVQDRTRVSAELEEAHRGLIDSLTYAGRIQQAVLPTTESFTNIFHQSFVFGKARDIVSGDFLWFYQTSRYKVVVLADCTGHGVPGALLSMVCNDLLNKIISEWAMMDPSAIIELLERGFQQIIQGSSQKDQLADGVDLGVVVIDYETKVAKFAGAERSLYVASKDGEVTEYKAKGKSIGVILKTNMAKVESTQIPLKTDDHFYMTSDGYYSQFGGRYNKKFMKSQFTQLIQNMQVFNLKKQGELIESTFDQWKGRNEQVDDILVVGFKPYDED
ncbi:MAG: PAS domain S-box protein [Flavobacteriales bacterium]